MATFDTIASRELEVYAVNFSSAHYNGVGRTLSKFWRKGTFNLDTAIGYIERNLCTPAAKDYQQEFGSMTTSWNSMFPKAERMIAAEAIARMFVNEFKLGNLWD
jgi:hypothetical protein